MSPARHIFSASQLESYAFCPFQFLARHLLRLESVESPAEFDEDPAARGSFLHDALEVFHKEMNPFRVA